MRAPSLALALLMALASVPAQGQQTTGVCPKLPSGERRRAGWRAGAAAAQATEPLKPFRPPLALLRAVFTNFAPFTPGYEWGDYTAYGEQVGVGSRAGPAGIGTPVGG